MASEITPSFRKSEQLERSLKQINEGVSGLFQDKKAQPKFPIIVLVGVARSGSTLLLQMLSACGMFSYPSNLVARFYSNPYFGILVQNALLEQDPSNQLGFEISSIDFTSSLGRTKGALNPSEFYYFWRNFFTFPNPDDQSRIEFDSDSVTVFLKELSAFELLYEKPLVMKGMIMNWNISLMHNWYDKFLFIHVKRDAVHNSYSLLKARESYYGSQNEWYSFKPPEYGTLSQLVPEEQVVGQVLYTNEAISRQLELLPNENSLIVDYETLCNDPEAVLKNICMKVEGFGISLPSRNEGNLNFTPSLSPKEESKLNKLKKIVNSFSND